MQDESRILDALVKIVESGCSPEEACGDHQQLLPEVKRRLREVTLIGEQVNLLFPETPATEIVNSGKGRAPLPKIEGYEVLEVLGHGGMGVVYRARHLKLNRIVALKMLLSGPYASVSEENRFLRESQAVAKLQHPNIVQIFDVQEFEGRPYFTMEFVNGGSLAQRLTGSPCGARDSAELVLTIAKAVKYAHDNGIIHRDLKPGNILLSQDGRPKIADFGLARQMESDPALTATGARMGTPSYMAPEQAVKGKQKVGAAVDVYALGVILYELLTGRPPFQSETVSETIKQLLDQDPVPPSRLNRAVPRDLETICLKCLQKEPASRYETGGLVDDLQKFLDGKQISARPEGRLGRAQRYIRKHPYWSTTVAICSLAGVITITGWIWLISERNAIYRSVNAEKQAIAQATMADLNEMSRFLEDSQWTDAEMALNRAKARSMGHPTPEIEDLLQTAERDQNLVKRWDEIRIQLADSKSGALDLIGCNEAYEQVFQDIGISPFKIPPEDVAKLIQQSSIRNAYISSLDTWSMISQVGDEKDWLLKVTILADEGADDWSTQVRRIPFGENTSIMDELLSVEISDQPITLLMNLASHVSKDNPLKIEFLKRVQAKHPDDFWVNLGMGRDLTLLNRFDEAVGYLRVAVALRPGVAVVHHSLAMALFNAGRERKDQGMVQDSIEHYYVAAKLDPIASATMVNLGHALAGERQFEKAVFYLEKGIALGGESAFLDAQLGICLDAIGQQEKADHFFHNAVELNKDHSQEIYLAARMHFMKRNLMDETKRIWETAIAANPEHFNTRYGFLEFCLYRNDVDAYLTNRKLLVSKYNQADNPYTLERVSRGCLLLDDQSDEVKQAIVMAKRIENYKDPKYNAVRPHFLFAIGLASYREGNYENAIAIMNGDAGKVLGPAPALVKAMALSRIGFATEARDVYDNAVKSHDWNPQNVVSEDGCIYHILRREAEEMIILKQ